MVEGCRIDAGLCKKDPPKTHGTRISCKTGAGLGGQRARRAELCQVTLLSVRTRTHVLAYISDHKL